MAVVYGQQQYGQYSSPVFDTSTIIIGTWHRIKVIANQHLKMKIKAIRR